MTQATATQPQPETESPFGPVIYAYTRKQALEDGEQVDVSKAAAEAGIKFPVYLTRAVYNQYVVVPQGVSGQDEAGRLWDIVWMFKRQIKPGPLMSFSLRIRNTERRGTPPLVTLKAECGPKDMDDPQPAITIMLPNED